MTKKDLTNIIKECFWEYNFTEEDLERLIDSYTLPTFKRDYMARRLNIIEYYFLDRPLTINKLKWVA